ncbi:MAG TPA: hypothetical protein VNM22_01685 [Candidatus Limnocylindrales bacterium]|nr:hypothetical protein [Candidatus Limnocylindrales bacterium]
MDEKDYRTDTEVLKASLKQSIEDTKENISHTVEAIASEVKESLDWRSWVRKYPVGFALGAMAVGYWIGKEFTPSAPAHLSSEAKKDINQIPNIVGSILAGLLIKKATEFIEGLSTSTPSDREQTATFSRQSTDNTPSTGKTL